MSGSRARMASHVGPLSAITCVRGGGGGSDNGASCNGTEPAEASVGLELCQQATGVRAPAHTAAPASVGCAAS